MNAHIRASALAYTIALAVPSMGAAQTLPVTTEVDLTTGYSTKETVRAAAAQLRVFGETRAGVRFHLEGTWADRSNHETDAFGAAYPYGGRVQVSEAYGERGFAHGATRTAVRIGQYRSPFGIFDRSDYAYSGLWRAPLMRYDGLWGVNNNFLERGADVIVSVPHLSLEASLGTPGDIGVARRRGGASGVVRAQAHIGDLTFGASHMSSAAYDREVAQPRRLGFTSVDARWMRGGIQVRGEVLERSPLGRHVDARVVRRCQRASTLHGSGHGRVSHRTARAHVADAVHLDGHGMPGRLAWRPPHGGRTGSASAWLDGAGVCDSRGRRTGRVRRADGVGRRRHVCLPAIGAIMLTRFLACSVVVGALFAASGLSASEVGDLRGVVRSVAGSEPSAVVWLEALAPASNKAAEKVVLAQHGLMFDPKLLVVRTGTTVEFPNDDRVFHNVFSFHDGKRFDLGTYPVGATRRVTFSTPGVSRVFCNIHPHMAAYIVAVDSPYFAVVKPDGTFVIADVPPGRYTYRAWRPSGSLATGAVVVPAGSPLDVVWP